MNLVKQTIYCILLAILVQGCKDTVFEKKAKKNRSNLAYAMLPPDEDLPKLSPEYRAQKHKEIQTFFDANFGTSFENISFLVAKNGQIIYEKYEGYANKEQNELITANTPLHIASVTKVFTASAVLKLIDAKKIGLDDNFKKYFPRFPYDDVTIRTLLNHRSGLKKYNYFCDDAAIWGRTKQLTNNDLLQVIYTKNIPKEYKADAHFSYNNTNYALLALLIEKVTGMKYKEAMKKIIFEPLEMNNTYVFDENSSENLMTPSYKGNYRKFGIDFLDHVYGDKNIYSTPRDLLKFDNARNASHFLSTALLKEMYKGYSYESKGIKNYGLGIRMREWETGQKLYYHNGWWHGNTSSYITMPKEHAVIIALSNKFNRKTYQLKKLSVLFGDYPFTLHDSIVKEE
jgi:CubicO group peptidase (beta-lactamase class C family)